MKLFTKIINVLLPLTFFTNAPLCLTRFWLRLCNRNVNKYETEKHRIQKCLTQWTSFGVFAFEFIIQKQDNIINAEEIPKYVLNSLDYGNCGKMTKYGVIEIFLWGTVICQHFMFLSICLGEWLCKLNNYSTIILLFSPWESLWLTDNFR